MIPPASVRSVENLGQAAKLTAAEVAALSNVNRRAADTGVDLGRSIKSAETSAGRYTRGMFAATAASTGFFRAVSFASGAFLIGATVGATIGAAVNEFTEMTRVGAQTLAIIRATGGAANVTAGQVDQLAQSQLALTGVDDELIKSAAGVLLTFRSIRNEGGAMNNIFDRSVKAALDISQVFGTNLRGSAVQLGKALQDPVRGVTALRRSGITLSAAQRDLIKEMVASGRILSAQKLILGEVERQVGGTAEAIGQTLPGRLRIMREESINSLGEFVKRISESERASRAFADTTAGIGQGIQTAFAGIRGIGELLAPLGAATSFLVRNTGGLKAWVSTISQGAVVIGGLALALKAASFAQGLYTRATTVATAATAAEGAAAAATSARIGIGAAALRLLSPQVLAVAGITALTVGLIKLKQAADNAPGTLNATRKALDGINDALDRGRKLESNLAGAREDVSISRFNVQAAQRAAEQARAAQARSTAAPGSLEQQGLSELTRQAEKNLTKAEEDLARAIRRRDVAAGQASQNERSRKGVIDDTTRALERQLRAAQRERSSILPTLSQPLGFFDSPDPLSVPEQFNSTLQLLNDLREEGDKTAAGLAAVMSVTEEIPTEKQIRLAVEIVGRGGTTNDVANRLLGSGRAGQPRVLESGTENIRLRGLVDRDANVTLLERVRAARAAVKAAREELAVRRETQRVARDELIARQQQVAAARDAVTAAREARTAAIEGLREAQRSLADAQRSLAETIRQSHQAIAEAIRAASDAVNQSVQDAKSNLDSLGQSVAEAIARFQDASGGRGGRGGALGERFRQLREQIARGQGGPETQKAAQQVAFTLQNRGQDRDASTITRDFADLTDNLNRGKISAREFNRQLGNLLKNLDLRSFERQFGTAAANLLRDQIRALRGQARALLDGPRRPGGGIAQQIIKPLQAVAAGARDIAAARRQAAGDIASAGRNIRDAQRDVTRAEKDIVRSNRQLAAAERRLRNAQRQATTANTTAVRANTRVQAQRLKLEQAQANLKGNKAKPKGGAGKENAALTGAGAGTP